MVADGAEVKEGQEIALVTIDEDQVETVKALTNGTIKFLMEEGPFIFNSDSGKELIEQGAHYLAEIKYDTPVPLRHPNGDIRENQIPFIVVWLILGATFFTFRMGIIKISRGFTSNFLIT